MIKRLIPIFVSALIFLPMIFAPSCANTTEAPTGGLKDTIPPVIVMIDPYPGTVNVPTGKITLKFTFDEYVTIKDPKNIFVSPPPAKAPVSKIHGKTLHVTFEDGLSPNTTYSVSFTDAIADNNEGNMFAGYTYVFSTGPQIDTMLITGVVQDCNTLAPVKGATVMLYKDHSDSAIFKSRPYAATKTDDWGFFSIPYIQDTLYRMYALKEENANNIYDPLENELVAYVDSLVRPVMVAVDTIPEMLKYDMTDTVRCRERKTEYELNLFREKPTRQYIVNTVRVSEKASYITFNAQNAWIDSLWIAGYPADRVITQFNLAQDSLEIWVNDSRIAPDTLHCFVNYRKTDSLGNYSPYVEHVRLFEEGVTRKTYSRSSKRNLKHDDTVCVFTLEAKGETVEQNGFALEFKYPIISEHFDSLQFRYLNPKQKEFKGNVKVERDSMNLRKYVIRPEQDMQVGYEYFLKVPQKCFRDINGFYSDSMEVKVSLPTEEELSKMNVVLSGVKGKYIVDLMDEKCNTVIRSFIIDSDCTLTFPYLSEGKYCIRLTEDLNRNSLVDTGDLLGHRQPEKVRFFNIEGNKFIDVPPSAEIEQNVDVPEMFK